MRFPVSSIHVPCCAEGLVGATRPEIACLHAISGLVDSCAVLCRRPCRGDAPRHVHPKAVVGLERDPTRRAENEMPQHSPGGSTFHDNGHDTDTVQATGTAPPCPPRKSAPHLAKGRRKTTTTTTTTTTTITTMQRISFCWP